MTFGPGSAELAPVAPFTFVKEELTGESAKFDVTDARGVTWVVKVGPGAQVEMVATRLVWSVGYFADEAYYFERAEIKNLPKLSRGKEFIENRSVVRGAHHSRRLDRGAGVRRNEEIRLRRRCLRRTIGAKEVLCLSFTSSSRS
ncbi:MAG TPA: hypothetical protein VGK82_13585 [Pyrinomonadaceae bacterium]